MAVSRRSRDGRRKDQRKVRYRELDPSDDEDGESEGGHEHSSDADEDNNRGRDDDDVQPLVDPVGSSNADDDDDEEPLMQRKDTAWTDLLETFRSGGWYALIAALLVGLAVAVVLIKHTHKETGRSNIENPKAVPRPIPSASEQARLKDEWMHGKAVIKMGGSYGDVALQALQRAGADGHVYLPVNFYEGVVFGVSAWYPYGKELSMDENRRRTDELREKLENLRPPADAIYRASWQAAADGRDDWYYEGFAVEFSIKNLLKNTGKKLHSRKDPAWTIAEEAVTKVARHFDQFKIHEWYPSKWGTGAKNDEHLHTSILQDIQMCRTGYRSMQSTTVVYRVDAPHVIRKPPKP